MVRPLKRNAHHLWFNTSILIVKVNKLLSQVTKQSFQLNLYLYIRGSQNVFQYFGNRRHNSLALDAFGKVVEVTTTLDNEILSLPDTLQALLTRFAIMAWSTTPESMVLCIPDLV